jgi:hypothetical protein
MSIAIHADGCRVRFIKTHRGEWTIMKKLVVLFILIATLLAVPLAVQAQEDKIYCCYIPRGSEGECRKMTRAECSRLRGYAERSCSECGFGGPGQEPGFSAPKPR